MPAEVASILPPPVMPPPLPLPPVAAVPDLPPPPAVERDPNACANCGHRLDGPFCSQCGQHVGDFHRSVWRFVADFFDNAFCWDNKLFLTLKPLLSRPGALTLDYLSGRRIRYVHPFRLFLFTSAVCLTLMQSLGSNTFTTNFTGDFSDDKPRQHRSAKALAAKAKAEKNAVPAAPGASPGASSSPAPAPATDPQMGSPAPTTAEAPPATPTPGAADANLTKGLMDQISRAVNEETNAARAKQGGGSPSAANEDPGKEIEKVIKAKVEAAGGLKGVGEHIRKIREDVQSRLSWVALALLPIFALMLRALYWRRDSYYFAHFVFSLHYHTFLLLFGVAYLLVGKLIPSSSSLLHDLKDLCFFAPGVYLFLALRRMYGEAIKRTIGKVLLLGSMHLLTLAIGLSAVGAFASYKEFKDAGSTSAASAPSAPSAPASPNPTAAPSL